MRIVKPDPSGSGMELWADVTVRVPSGGKIAIEHAIGGIEANGVDGQLELSTRSGNVGIEKIEPSELADTLMKNYRIFTVAINRPGVRGLRISPNLYTTLDELDELVSAIKELAA